MFEEESLAKKIDRANSTDLDGVLWLFYIIYIFAALGMVLLLIIIFLKSLASGTWNLITFFLCVGFIAPFFASAEINSIINKKIRCEGSYEYNDLSLSEYNWLNFLLTIKKIMLALGKLFTAIGIIIGVIMLDDAFNIWGNLGGVFSVRTLLIFCSIMLILIFLKVSKR